MNSLKNIYESELKLKLKDLEGRRIKVRNLSIITGVLYVVGLIQYTLADAGDNHDYNWLIVVCLPSALYLSFKLSSKKKAYKKAYKKDIVTHVVRSINSDWKYSHDEKINPDEYWKSDLFEKKYDKYSGDDLITGIIDKTDFRCSDLHTEYKTTTVDSKGRKKTQWHTIFRGLFFHADFNKHFLGRTYITTESEGFFGWLGEKFKSEKDNTNLVNLENPEFEDLFIVNSTNQQEARYILTPTIMEALVKLKQNHEKKIYISFIGSRVYCAFSFTEGLFEPKIFRSGVNFNDVKTIYDLIALNHQIVKDLNLNTRIWTKD